MAVGRFFNGKRKFGAIAARTAMGLAAAAFQANKRRKASRPRARTNLRMKMGGSRNKTRTLYKGRGLSKRARGNITKKRRFATKVRKALSSTMPMSTLIEKTTSGLEFYTVQNPNLGMTQYVDKGLQYVFGDTDWFMLRTNVAGWREKKIFSELYEYNQVNNGVIGNNPATDDDLGMKIRVTHQKTQITLTNISTASDLKVDVYEFIAAKTQDDSKHNSPAQSFFTLSADAVNNRELSNLSTFACTLKGVTPLDMPGFGRYWKLLNKKRIIVPYSQDGDADPYQVVELSVRPFTTSLVQDEQTIKGQTKGLIMIISPDNVDTEYGADAFICRVGTQTRTHFKVVEQGSVGNLPSGLSAALSHSANIGPVGI
jgi:hypothetical protein